MKKKMGVITLSYISWHFELYPFIAISICNLGVDFWTTKTVRNPVLPLLSLYLLLSILKVKRKGEGITSMAYIYVPKNSHHNIRCYKCMVALLSTAYLTLIPFPFRNFFLSICYSYRFKRFVMYR